MGPWVQYTVPAIVIVEKINHHLCEIVIPTVITRQYTVPMAVTNRKLPIRRCCDPTIIMASPVTHPDTVCWLVHAEQVPGSTLPSKPASPADASAGR